MQFGQLETITLTAAADLSAKRHHIVRLSAANTTNQASNGLARDTVGVLQNAPLSGEAADVALSGHSMIVAGAALAAGAQFATNGSGRAAAVASGSTVVGILLTASAADGDIVQAYIYGGKFSYLGA